MSISTIETHRVHIKEKLNLHSTAELLRHAIEWVHSLAS
ncbi:MAG: LuxR C-terminal-related transcriptional regulator [Limisphaerales bacterium]